MNDKKTQKVAILGSGIGIGTSVAKILASKIGAEYKFEREPESYKSLNKKHIFKEIKK